MIFDHIFERLNIILLSTSIQNTVNSIEVKATITIFTSSNKSERKTRVIRFVLTEREEEKKKATSKILLII